MNKTEEGFSIPAGYCLRKIGGGRPAKDARNVAIFLARKFRISQLDNLAKQADEWILEQWEKEPGMSETAHIRRAVRAAAPFVNKSFLILSDKFASSVRPPLCNGAPGWLWCPGMTVALAVSVNNFSATVTAEMLNMSPVAVAARKCLAEKS